MSARLVVVFALFVVAAAAPVAHADPDSHGEHQVPPDFASRSVPSDVDIERTIT